MERNKEIYRATLLGGVVNIVLLLCKFVAGIVGHSAAMLADAIHSLSDFFTDIIVLVFIHISGKPQDKSHDYGHGKYETLATTLIGFALLAVAVGIIWSGASKIIDWWQGEQLPAPGMLAFWVALLSIVMKEGDLTEQSLPDKMEEEMLHMVSALPGVVEPHNLRTRRIGSHYAIELHIRMDGDISLHEAHEKATEVERLLRKQYGEDTHVAVHVEPTSPSI